MLPLVFTFSLLWCFCSSQSDQQVTDVQSKLLRKKSPVFAREPLGSGARTHRPTSVLWNEDGAEAFRGDTSNRGTDGSLTPAALWNSLFLWCESNYSLSPADRNPGS